MNLPVCTAANNQISPVLVTDLKGGAIIVWADGRGASFDIYGQHVTSAGNVDGTWPLDGVALCAAPGTQGAPCIVSDAAGGAIIAWTDLRSGTGSDIYAQHLLASGAVDAAWPVNGLPICTASGNQQNAVAVADGAGGAVIVWQDFRAGTQSDVFAQHVRASGTVDLLWPANGIAACPVVATKTRPRLAPSGNSGVLVVWTDSRSDSSGDVYCQRLLLTGSADPSWPANGVAVCVAPNTQDLPEIAPDSSGGALIVWEDKRNGVDFDLYCQRVLASGVPDPRWPVNGQVVCNAPNNQVEPLIVSDGVGGGVMGWRDFRSTISFNDIYAQRIAADGQVSTQWPTNGRLVCGATNNQLNLTMAADGSSGALLAWGDSRVSAGNGDIYVQHVRSDGSNDPQWLSDGVAASKAANLQQTPKVIQDGAGGALLVWQDGRSAGITDIYAQRVGPNGALGGSVTGVPAPLSPEPTCVLRVVSPVFGRFVSCNGATPGDVPAVLDVLDVSGRCVASQSIQGERHGFQADIRLPDDASSGIYFLRLKQGRTSTSGRIVVLR